MVNKEFVKKFRQIRKLISINRSERIVVSLIFV